MSSSAVVTNMAINMKKGCTSEFNRCKFVIMNPELTYTLSDYQTACGVVDIMSHTLERYFSVCDPTPLTDGIAESLLKAVISAGKILVENPKDYNARATVMWASSAGYTILNTNISLKRARL
jgi:alcohol dehydrogenase YqhD (iron-dependent ADH family)